MYTAFIKEENSDYHSDQQTMHLILTYIFL